MCLPEDLFAAVILVLRQHFWQVRGCEPVPQDIAFQDSVSQLHGPLRSDVKCQGFPRAVVREAL